MRFSLACERQKSCTVVSAMPSGVPHLCVNIRDGGGLRGGSGVVSTETLLLTKLALQEAVTGGKRPISVVKTPPSGQLCAKKKP